MTRTTKTARAALVGALLGGWLLAASLPATAVLDLAGLPGRWSGWGSIQMTNGATEQVKCIATYLVSEGAAGAPVQRLTHNLRCASASFRIDAAAILDIRDGVVSGRWEERTYEARGTVAGKLTVQGLSLSITGERFSAAMVVATGPCKQMITIAPSGLDIARIAVGLDKC